MKAKQNKTKNHKKTQNKIKQKTKMQQFKYEKKYCRYWTFILIFLCFQGLFYFLYGHGIWIHPILFKMSNIINIFMCRISGCYLIYLAHCGIWYFFFSSLQGQRVLGYNKWFSIQIWFVLFPLDSAYSFLKQ